MKVTLIKDKFGKLSPEPSFTPDGPVFYRIINPELLAIAKEGEQWEAETTGQKSPTGKKDRRGKNIYTQAIRLIDRDIREYPPIYKHKDGKWFIRRFSGYIEITPLIFEEDGRRATFSFPYIYLLSHFQNETDIIEKLNVWENRHLLPDGFPSWVDESTKKAVMARIAAHEKTIAEEKQMFSSAQERRKSILSSGGPLPHDLLREFVLKGVKVLWQHPNTYIPDYRMLFYGHEGSLFGVGDFVFELGIEDIDEDYIIWANSFSTSSGDISDPALIKIMKDIAYFAASPKEKSVDFLGLSRKSKDTVLFQKEIPISFSVDTIPPFKDYYEEHIPSDMIPHYVEELYKEVSSAVSDYQEKTVVSEFQDLVRIVYSSRLDVFVDEVYDIEEGIGAKDATTYTSRKLLARVTEVWECKEIYISPQVNLQVAQGNLYKKALRNTAK